MSASESTGRFGHARLMVLDLEMFRAPQMGNPIIVRPEEDAEIRRLVGS